jgi:acyl carrier protein
MSTEEARSRLRARIIAYLHDEFRIPKSDLDPEVKLVRTGVLDSVHLVQLATWLEETFGVTIPDQDIDVDHFDSVAMIVDYLEARVPEDPLPEEEVLEDEVKSRNR